MRKVYGPQVRFLLKNGLRPIEVARAMGIPVARVHQIKYRDRLKEEEKQTPQTTTLWDRIKRWLS